MPFFRALDSHSRPDTRSPSSRSHALRKCQLERLDARHMLAAEPVISEFMAANQSTILDGYGLESDWIEITNIGDASVDLAGWRLTDDAADFAKWVFPARTLGIGESMIVFGSDADPSVPDPAGYLHASFKLSAAGEYLALVRPDGAVASEIGSAIEPFPAQLDDVSYGLPMTTLIAGPVADDDGANDATLIGHWKLDEPASINPTAPGTDPTGWDSVVDSSGRGFGGSFQDLVGNGPVAGTAGARPDTGTSVDFDGVNQEINLGSPQAFKLANQFTISAWINPDVVTAGRTQRVFGQNGGGYSFGIIGDEFKFTTWGIRDYQTTTATIVPGTWNHVAMVLDANNDATFYHNGNLIGTIAGDLPANISGNNFSIASNGTAERFGGMLDDIRLYNGALTGDEVRAILGLPPAVITPIGHWTLDESVNPSSGTLAVDMSGSAFNGTYLPTGGVGGATVGAPGATVDTGTSATFNGTTDRVSVGAPAQLRITSNFTIAAWIKPNATPSGVVQRIFSQTPGGGYGFGLTGSELRFTTYGRKDYDTSTADEVSIAPGVWTHVAVVFDGSFDASFYVNGELAEVIPGDFAATASASGLFIGSTGAAANAENFGGSIDDVRFYNQLLNHSQLEALAGQTPTVEANAAYFVPASAAIDATWMLPSFDDSSWHGASTAIGFEGSGDDFASLIGTELPGAANSVYVRTKFIVDDPSTWDTLMLRMIYDDGFVAYLNGGLVARSNAPTSLGWDSMATATRPNSVATTLDGFDISSALGLLTAGENVLAIHALNAGDDDMLIAPELWAMDSSGTPRFISTPTPGGPNTSDGFIDIVSDTSFSIDRGFFSAPFTVEITSPTTDATIVYTTNGSTPSVNAQGAITNGIAYSGPINVSSTTTLRAAAFKPGYRSTNIDTQTYVFIADVMTQSPIGTAPAGWPSAPINGQTFNYGMDPDIVNSAIWGPQLDDALTAIPSISIVTDMANLMDPTRGIYVNAEQRGAAWERPASVELINPDGTEGFQADVGLRIRGGFSRGDFNPKHSFRLFFDSSVGPEKLNFPLFGSEGDDVFDKVDLRTAQNYAWSNDTFNDASRNTFLRDVFSRDVMREMGQPYTRTDYYHLYINGQYWGLYETEERPEKNFAESYLGGNDDDYDVLSNRGLVDGTEAAWNQTWALATTGFATDATYYAVQGKNPDGTDNPALPVYVDVDNLIDYMTVIFYTGNFDGPVAGSGRNNFYAIRSRVDREGWQFVAHDSEHSMMNINEDRTGPLNVGSTLATFNPQWIHERLMAHPEYRLRFADRVQEHLFGEHGVLTPENAAALMMSRAVEIDTAIIAESARWGDQHEAVPYTKTHWQTEVAWLMNTWFPQRTAIVLNQLRADGLYPNVPAPTFNQDGGRIDPGFDLIMSAPTSQTFADTVLVGPSASARALVPTTNAIESTWFQKNFVDTAWPSGASPVGYDRTGANFPLEADRVAFNVLSQMDPNGASPNEYNSIYVRYEFNLAANFNAAAFERLLLRIKYDDAFVAYLNGQEIGRGGPLPTTVGWNAAATAARTQSLVLQDEEFNISSFLSALAPGKNVLAFQLLNVNFTSSDLYLRPQLVLGDLQSSTSNPIYYTLDGSDPRLPGGAINPAAVLYSGAVTLDATTTVNARAMLSGAWSAVNSSLFSVESPIRVSEIMYHPAQASGGETYGDRDAYEFLELLNISETASVDLEGYGFGDGISFIFPAITLGPGERVVVVNTAEAFAERYGSGIQIAGEFSGNLSNAGEPLVLVGPQGEIVHEFSYDDEWYAETDGGGRSLVAVDPDAPAAAWSTAAAWKASLLLNGSPTTPDVLVGDLDGDNRVGLLDLAILQSHFGLTSGATLGEGDLNGDGAVTRADVVLLAKNFGASIAGPLSPSPAAAGAVVVARGSHATDQDADLRVTTRLTAQRRNGARQETSTAAATDSVMQALSANGTLSNASHESEATGSNARRSSGIARASRTLSR
jgi:hypothetical protein